MSKHTEIFEKHEENGIKIPEEGTLLRGGREEREGRILDEVEYEVDKDFKDNSKPYTSIRRVSEIAHQLYVDGETVCGIGTFKGKFLQRFANKNTYVIMYGILGCVMGACGPYLTGTITTLEKRFKIPSTKTGIIMVGYDVSTLALCLLLNYYGSRGHRPRWVAFGVYTTVLFCLMSAAPQLLYGSGDDALALTLEHGGTGGLDVNATSQQIDAENRRSLCLKESAGASTCDKDSGDLAPMVVLFLAQLLGGAGGSTFYTLGVAYMDDNIKRSKAPALISFSFFLRMLGPAIGFGLASLCLSFYISPSLTPTIDTKDPRWVGAWWLGWLILAVALSIFAIPMLLFPKSLPRATARRIHASERRDAGITSNDEVPVQHDMPASFKDMLLMFKRLLLNKTLTFNTCASIFYLLGYIPFWVFMAKYIEIMYRRSASSANFITGAVGLTFSAIGVLVSGVFMSKYKPRARFCAAWNTFVSFASVVGIASYAFLGCPINNRQGTILPSGQLETTTECNIDCHCDYVKYSPVCAPDGRTFISPCHAGCKDYRILPSGAKVFTNCTCVPSPPDFTLWDSGTNLTDSNTPDDSWILTDGSCPVDCSIPFYIFLSIVCINKFIGASGRTSNFLVSVRCVDEKDKTMAMALGMMLVSTFAFLPSPIIFGYLIDKTCLVWGKTCTGTGNCWVYDPEMLRYLLNFTSAGFLAIGTMFDVAVWFTVKDLKIFDEEVTVQMSPQRTKTQRS